MTLDEVWVKLDKTKQSREELKSENTRLKGVVSNIKNEQGCLHLAGVLLSASLRTNSVQLTNLSLQQLLSNRLAKDFVYLKRQVIDLVDILRTEIGENDGNLRPKSMQFGKKMPLVLRFRRAVIVVLAANRFYHHASYAPQYISIGKCLFGIKSEHLLAISCKDQKSFQFKGTAIYDPLLFLSS